MHRGKRLSSRLPLQTAQEPAASVRMRRAQLVADDGSRYLWWYTSQPMYLLKASLTAAAHCERLIAT
jgi:hypothetical protein